MKLQRILLQRKNKASVVQKLKSAKVLPFSKEEQEDK